MILVDANLLIYAVNEDSPLHRRAKLWLDGAIAGPDSVGLSWNVLMAFLRVATRPNLFRNPLAVETALDLMALWLDQPNVTVVEAGPHHLRILRELLLSLGSGGNLTSDAHLAALAIEHGLRIPTSLVFQGLGEQSIRVTHHALESDPADLLDLQKVAAERPFRRGWLAERHGRFSNPGPTSFCFALGTLASRHRPDRRRHRGLVAPSALHSNST